MKRMIARTILYLVMGLVYDIAQAQKSVEVQSVLDRRMRLIEGKISSEQIAEDYYIIVGVYSHYKGACTKMKRIQQLRIKVTVFTYPESRISYTYIEKAFDTHGRAGGMLLKLLRLPEFSETKLQVLRVGNKSARQQKDRRANNKRELRKVKMELVKMISCLCRIPMMNACGTAKKPTGVYKTGVSANYYHDKSGGRKAVSGAIFSNNKLTTTHPFLLFGTQLKATDRANGESVVVTVTDGGSFAKGRELDLTKRAFVGITDNKNKGMS